MLEIIYRYDPDDPRPTIRPETAAAARSLLEQGNARFASLIDPRTSGESVRRVVKVVPEDLGIAADPGKGIKQAPFAIVLGCADARVPVELIFGQGANDLFVLRVAGNVLGAEVLGSIDYALHNLTESIRLIVVLGHSGCGAVMAAVDAWLEPASYLALAGEHHLRAIVDQILPAVHLAAHALTDAWGSARTQPGYRSALIETAVVVNAAQVAATIGHHLEASSISKVGVVFGVFDIERRAVSIPGLDPDHPLANRLITPTLDPATFAARTIQLAHQLRDR